MFDLTPRERLTASIPRCPVTPTMRRNLEKLSKNTGIPMVELQRQAMSLFLDSVCQNWPQSDEDTSNSFGDAS